MAFVKCSVAIILLLLFYGSLISTSQWVFLAGMLDRNNTEQYWPVCENNMRLDPVNPECRR